MYSKGKGLQQQAMLSIESQAKEKLNIYVYEFLLHLGAKNTAQSFLNELRWEKPLIGEAPGFLLSWWSVFWDLYCAATPERQNQFEASNEAKTFHDYTANMLMNQQQPPTDPNNPMQPNPNHQMMNPNNNFFNAPGGQGPNNPMMNAGQQFQRFHPTGPRPIRMPSNMEFNPAANNMNPGGPDQNRVPAGMSPLSRLTPPGNRMQGGMPPQQGPGGQMNYNGAPNPQQMRGPPNQAPTPGQQIPNAPMSPMSMSIQQQQQQRWNSAQNNNTNAGPPQPQGHSQQQAQQQSLPPPPPPPHNMNYSSASSPIPYSNVAMTGHHGPGTPGIIPSPQDANGEINFSNLMKNVPGGIQFQDQNMGHMVPLQTDLSHHNQLNSEIMDSIKHSPIQNIQVNRHPNEEHNGGNPMNEINYGHFGDAGSMF